MADEIPGFEIEKVLGQGGTGTVYLARDVEADRQVALKVLPLEADPTRRARFELEAQVGSLLEHDDIIRVYGTGVVGDAGWISMELLDGFELAAAMREEAFGLEDRIRVIMRVALALHYAHEKDIIHRDVKPANIYLTRDGDVKLLDFGIARLKANKITKTGFIVGTPQFMAPEQISALKVDPRTDVFSLGVVLYELLCGELPWGGDNHTQVMMAVCSKPPKPLRSLFDGSRFGLEEAAVEHLVRIVHKAIRQEPEHRYASSKEFAKAIQRFLDGRHDERRDTEAPVHIDADEFMKRRIDWSIARAARLKVEESAPMPVPSKLRKVEATQEIEDEEKRSNVLFAVLLGVFVAALAGALFLLSGD